MRNKLLSAIALGVLLAGCECSPEASMEAGSAPVPGSAEDFKANVKDRVFFAFNKHNVSAESDRVLEAQAAWFKTYPNTTAVVEGHADARGTREYNLALGKRRAHAAHVSLTKHGVEKKRLKEVSYGKDRPFVADATTEEAHAQNRVAVTVVN
ncbi:OmpA family protein [Candidatus Odyssella acanthamoebae]|uniref:OmpA/MotB n=1 Tax=Candidatus Odyssella acanthamoebae TaxID=91604 RepID=A0A077AUG5_9PROT|nr:OmpA family protein [Candidatus Paracaedibacter acanthamoebae]AIK96827.1 OmpA/MotB [Candidatus Paracaedibacter acanthamoebae]